MSAPQATYDFPDTTCVSVNKEIAPGIPGERRLAAGDWVNIDVSAFLNGYFADTGASFCLGSVQPSLDQLRRDGKRALQIGMVHERHQKRLIGISIETRLYADP